VSAATGKASSRVIPAKETVEKQIPRVHDPEFVNIYQRPVGTGLAAHFAAGPVPRPLLELDYPGKSIKKTVSGREQMRGLNITLVHPHE